MQVLIKPEKWRRSCSMTKTKKFEVLNYLKTEKDIEDYLNIVLEEGDYKFLPVALADIARARKAMSTVAKAAGVTRTSLYQSLAENGNPAFETIAKVAQTLGYRITLVPLSKSTGKASVRKRTKSQKVETVT